MSFLNTFCIGMGGFRNEPPEAGAHYSPDPELRTSGKDMSGYR